MLSQKHELAVCKPAPFFCIITHVTEHRNNILQIFHQKERQEENKFTDIFKRLAELCQLIETCLDHTRRPRVDFVLLIGIASDGALDGLLDYVAHLIHNKCSLEKRNTKVEVVDRVGHTPTPR